MKKTNEKLKQHNKKWNEKYLNNQTWNSHHELCASKNLIYNPSGFQCSNPIIDAENNAYGAYVFKVNKLFIRFRVAKITPTKVGQFVTLWKRTKTGSIQPCDVSDQFDFLVISTRKNTNFGHFVFPKMVLYEHDIISKHGKGGKRAIRVYPSWDKTTSMQAQKTQSWQVKYFLEIPQNETVNYNQIKALYGID